MNKTKKLTKTEIDNLISPEVEEAMAEYEMQRNILDRIPVIKEGEDYIYLRYPVHFNFSRADLQEIAINNIKRLLTEKEMEQLEDVIIDQGKAFDELRVAIIDAICEVTDKEVDGPYTL